METLTIKMKKIIGIHIQREELLGVTLGAKISFKKLKDDDGIFYEIYEGEECIDDYLITNKINDELKDFVIDKDLIVKEGGGKHWGQKFWQLPEKMQTEILKLAGFEND